ncbi:hypothetical protein [Rathayibacter sp. VKM Ac-2857]|uniref:hypothetical protein n=1 Tax=Rathayibacter sp. VKM Ac-2857 TaxID=2739020 RepID=UPI0015632FB6|nr:hypothetical protein [Rathayibacter sp. VKM Ac-2857]NQX17999.1 hypothetical protein [Rathayibacter sp. VKM Ac-2857]
MRVRAMVHLAVLSWISVLMLGCTQAEAPQPLTPPSPYFATAPAPDGAVYRSFYRGGVKGYEISRARWLDDGDGLEVSIGGSSNCLHVPSALEVLASDHLLIRTEKVAFGGCVEDFQYWTFVFDTPEGLDATEAVDVDIVDEDSSIGAEVMAPRTS